MYFLWENAEKYITFTVPRSYKSWEKWVEITQRISYMLQFIDSARFMASSLSNLVNNFSEGIHKIKCKYRHNDKKCKTCGMTYKVCNRFLEYTNFKDYLIEHNCLCWKLSGKVWWKVKGTIF